MKAACVRNVKMVSKKKFADINVESLIGEVSIAFFLDRKEWRDLSHINTLYIVFQTTGFNIYFDDCF